MSEKYRSGRISVIASLPSRDIFIRILRSANSSLGAIGASITNPSKSFKNFSFSLNFAYFAGSNFLKFTQPIEVAGKDLAADKAQGLCPLSALLIAIAGLSLSLTPQDKASNLNPLPTSPVGAPDLNLACAPPDRVLRHNPLLAPLDKILNPNLSPTPFRASVSRRSDTPLGKLTASPVNFDPQISSEPRA